MTDGLPTPRRYLAILALSVGTAVSVIDGTIANVALPNLARDLGIAPSLAVLVVTVYQLTLITTLLPLSALGQRIGLKKLYFHGQMIFIIASVLCFFARSLPFLLVVRVVQGVGAAAIISVSGALIRAIYPLRLLGRGLAFGSAVVAVSNVISPTLGGLLISVASWPWLFAAAVPLAVFSLLLGRVTLPDIPTHDEPYDLPGALLCAATFGMVIGGLESLVHGDSPVVSLAVLAFGVAVGWVFVRRELGTDTPILPVDLLRQRVLALTCIGAVLAFIASMELMLSMPFRLQEHYGFKPGEVGALITPWPLAMMVVAPLAGLLADRYAAGILGAIGMAISALGFVLLATLPAVVTHFDIAWRVALCGAGYGLYMTPSARLVVLATPMARSASASGLNSTTRLLGQTLGATVLAGLLAIGHGTDSTPPWLSAALALLACLCSLGRIPNQSRYNI